MALRGFILGCGCIAGGKDRICDWDFDQMLRSRMHGTACLQPSAAAKGVAAGLGRQALQGVAIGEAVLQLPREGVWVSDV